MKIVIIFTLILFSSSYVDPPVESHYMSENKRFLMTVIPAKNPVLIDKKLEKMVLKQKNKIDTNKCYARFYEINQEDTVLVWKRNMINSDAPGFVLITHDGKRVITFEDHYVSGTDNDIVIYNEKGQFLKRYSCHELAKGCYSGGVSWIDWLEDYELKGNILSLKMKKGNCTDPFEIIDINSVVTIDLFDL